MYNPRLIKEENTHELLRKLLKDLQIISEELAEYINSSSWNRSTFYDDDDEHSIQYKEYLENSSNAIAPVLPTEEPEYSLSMGDEHLSTIPETESDEVIKSSVKNIVPIPSESEVTSDNESECDVPVNDESSLIFTTFLNPLFDCNDDFTSSDEESLSNEDVPIEIFKIYLNSLFNDEESIPTKIDQHYFNAESNLIESLPNQDTLIDFSPKFDYLLELAHINLIPSGIEEADFDLEEEIHLVENLLYDNLSARPPEELNAEIADTISFLLPVKKFPQPEYFPTASKEMFLLLSQRDAPAEEVCTAEKLKVIEFSDSYEAPQEESSTGSTSAGSAKKKGRTVAVTTEDMEKKRNDVKVRTTLLLALPDEHQLRFSKPCKSSRVIDVEIEQDGLNQKFLTSLAPEWLMYTIVWRNRSDIDTMSLDDLYNHLKVYEPEVLKKSESNFHNMAFISSAKNSSGKGEVNTASISKRSRKQLGKTIKSLRSDHGGEYTSQEFLDHLKELGIISHRTPPYTLQHNDLKASGSVEDLELIQEEDTNHSLDTSLDHEEDDQEIDEPQSDINPIRKSFKTRRAPDRMWLYIDAEEHELGDLGEPANYKAALLDLESKKWIDVMNVKIQSMKDNDVWVLVKLPATARTVGSKWLFKKKTDMDGAVYVFKARFVAKGFTQTYRVDYEETFSPVADIRAIRILIAITAYYDYEIRINYEAVWIRKFIYGLDIAPTIEEPISMYCDNTGAIAIVKDDGVTKGARHFHLKVHYLRETIKLVDVKIEKVDTDDNLADPFTKALAFPKHSELLGISECYQLVVSCNFVF
uniref:Reverse transcriptase Ty1/copia-type domain-containing protein n=1 Tax=Tanacetum cinerariifolium TaxID=118510 RepID=A0A6L2LVQ4_TANCI|nr:hypothetical protein [Tanacetum cinerariifolium]